MRERIEREREREREDRGRERERERGRERERERYGWVDRDKKSGGHRYEQTRVQADLVGQI